MSGWAQARVSREVVRAMDQWEKRFRGELRRALLHLASESETPPTIDPGLMPAAVRLACAQLAEKISDSAADDGQETKVA